MAKHPKLTASPFFSRTPSRRSAVPRSSSNLENTERKRVKSRLKKLIMKRPPLQALQEKGLIKGESCFYCSKRPLPLDVNFMETQFYSSKYALDFYWHV